MNIFARIDADCAYFLRTHTHKLSFKYESDFTPQTFSKRLLFFVCPYGQNNASKVSFFQGSVHPCGNRLPIQEIARIKLKRFYELLKTSFFFISCRQSIFTFLFLSKQAESKRSTLFFYKNVFYKNIEAEICEILRMF